MVFFSHFLFLVVSHANVLSVFQERGRAFSAGALLASPREVSGVTGKARISGGNLAGWWWFGHGLIIMLLTEASSVSSTVVLLTASSTDSFSIGPPWWFESQIIDAYSDNMSIFSARGIAFWNLAPRTTTFPPRCRKVYFSGFHRCARNLPDGLWRNRKCGPQRRVRWSEQKSGSKKE